MRSRTPHLFLTDEEIRKALAPESVIVIGRTTLSRSTNAFIALAKEVIVIDPRISNVDKNRSANQLLTALPLEVISDSAQDNRWQIASEPLQPP
jgi:2-succinyl-5-enolpyruvyl-6-hydroxy-3-cyclohexene-1-carboxylate synthase